MLAEERDQTFRCYRLDAAREAVCVRAKARTGNAGKSGRHGNARAGSRVLQEVIRQAPAEHVTVGRLTSTLHRHSFGIVMLSLGLLAMTPVGSTLPGLMLAVMAMQLIV